MKKRFLSIPLALVLLFCCSAVATSAEIFSLPKLEIVSMHSLKAYPVSSGTAEWSWSHNGKTSGVAIDAIAPWMRTDLTTVPAGTYRLKWSTTPDKVRVWAYQVQDKERYDAEPVEEQEVDRPYKVKLRPGRIYVVYAVWGNAHLQADGGCGNVEYAFQTA